MNKFLKRVIKLISFSKNQFVPELVNSYQNKTTKTIISANAHLTLNSKTQVQIELVKKNITELLNKNKDNPLNLLEYVKTSGTKIFYVKNASKKLRILNEQEGLICELKGIDSIILCLMLHMKISLFTKPLMIFENEEPNDITLIYNFYKWYSLKNNLPGFEYQAQKKLKKYLKNINDTSSLSINSILDLQEAIARDKEATEFALLYARDKEGAKKVKKKITEGGANI